MQGAASRSVGGDTTTPPARQGGQPSTCSRSGYHPEPGFRYYPDVTQRASPPPPSAHDADVITRRLVLAKGFYQRGAELGSTGSDLDGMLAIHHVHLAVETTLRVVAAITTPQSGKKNLSFEDLIEQIEVYSQQDPQRPRLPLLEDLRTLNRERNSVQHRARASHPDYVRDATVVTLRILRDVFTKFLHRDFDSISERDFIADSNLRALTQCAHDLAALGTEHTAQDAMAALVFCLDHAFESVLARIHDRRLPHQDFHPRALAGRSQTAALEEEILLLATRVDVIENRWLRRLAPRVLVARDGSISIDVTDARSLSHAGCGRAERFAISCILSWQRMGLEPRYIGAHTSIDQFVRLYAVALQRGAPSVIE